MSLENTETSEEFQVHPTDLPHCQHPSNECVCIEGRHSPCCCSDPVFAIGNSNSAQGEVVVLTRKTNFVNP